MERTLTDDYAQMLYPDVERDKVDEFCRKCFPTVRRMFTNLTAAREDRQKDLIEIGERVLPLVDRYQDFAEYHPDTQALEAVVQLCQELEELRQLRDRTELDLREKALAWAQGRFAAASIDQAQATGDAVLALADRYVAWLSLNPPS